LKRRTPSMSESLAVRDCRRGLAVDVMSTLSTASASPCKPIDETIYSVSQKSNPIQEKLYISGIGIFTKFTTFTDEVSGHTSFKFY